MPMPQPREWRYLRARQEFLCPCSVGHYPCWVDPNVHGECPLACCSDPDFPGREPRPGDLALCGHGTLGLVTSTGRKPVSYPDGQEAEAWCGVHLTCVKSDIGSPWSSRSPCVLAPSIWDLLALKRRGRALSMPHLHLKPYLVDGWPTNLQYVEPSRVARFLEWLNPYNLQHLLDQRAEEHWRAAA